MYRGRRLFSVENFVKPPRALNCREVEQNAGEIILPNVAQFPLGIAILKIEGKKQRAQPRRSFFVSHSSRACGHARYPDVKIELPVEQVAPALEKIVAASLRRLSNAPLLAWPLACGSAVAERTSALEFSGGVLRVEVPDAGWRAELQHLAPRYLAVINRYAARPVSRIDFVIRGRGQNTEVRVQT